MERNVRWTSLVTALAATALIAPGTWAADHLDAPLIVTDGRQDINDLYVFQSPNDPSRTALIMTVNPGAGVFSPEAFDSNALYTFEIDVDGDAVKDVRYRFRFSTENEDGSQDFRVLESKRQPVSSEPGAPLVIQESILGRGNTADGTTSLTGGGLVAAGLFDDPFFFDLIAFNSGFSFSDPGEDFFAGLNVTAIVLELPTENISENPNIGVWAQTSIDEQMYDRVGRPAINSVLIPLDFKSRFNIGLPKNDQRDYREIVIETLVGVLGNDFSTANSLADVLLPDILTFDTSNPSGFLNGRRLADDVIDLELELLTGGAITSDGVPANDAAFSDAFPYLAPAN